MRKILYCALSIALLSGPALAQYNMQGWLNPGDTTGHAAGEFVLDGPLDSTGAYVLTVPGGGVRGAIFCGSQRSTQHHDVSMYGYLNLYLKFSADTARVVIVLENQGSANSVKRAYKAASDIPGYRVGEWFYLSLSYAELDLETAGDWDYTQVGQCAVVVTSTEPVTVSEAHVTFTATPEAGRVHAGEDAGPRMLLSHPNMDPNIEIGTISATIFSVGWFFDQLAGFGKIEEIPYKQLAVLNPSRPGQGSLEELPRLAGNVVGIVGNYNYETAYLASRELIVPIDKFLPDPEFSLDIFDSNHWPIVTYDGKIWGIPWYVNTLNLLCNWSLFEAEGITEPPKTWEEFFEYAQRLTKDTDGDGKIDQWGFHLGRYSQEKREQMWSAMNLQRWEQLGVEDPGPWKTQTHAKENFERLYDFFNSEYVNALENALWQGRMEDSGRVAMQIVHNMRGDDGFTREAASAVLAAGSRYRFAFMPTFGPKAVGAFDERFLAVRKSTPEKEAASWEFLKWMCRQGISTQLEGSPNAVEPFWYAWPARKDYEDDAVAFSEYYNGDPTVDAHKRIEAASWMRATPPIGGKWFRPGQDTQAYYESVLRRAFAGSISWDQAAAELDENLEKYGWSPPQPPLSYELHK